MAKRKFDPVHPGVVLAKDFLKELELSQYRLAKGLAVSPRRTNENVQGKRAITADTALRLGKFFAIEPQFWMNLQSHYDLEVAKDAISGTLPAESSVRAAPASPRLQLVRLRLGNRDGRGGSHVCNLLMLQTPLPYLSSIIYSALH